METFKVDLSWAVSPSAQCVNGDLLCKLLQNQEKLQFDVVSRIAQIVLVKASAKSDSQSQNLMSGAEEYAAYEGGGCRKASEGGCEVIL